MPFLTKDMITGLADSIDAFADRLTAFGRYGYPSIENIKWAEAKGPIEIDSIHLYGDEMQKADVDDPMFGVPMSVRNLRPMSNFEHDLQRDMVDVDNDPYNHVGRKVINDVLELEE